MNFETAKYECSLPAKSFFRTAVFGGGSISGAGVQIAPTSSPPRAVLIDIARAVAVCAAPAANREQTQIASALTTILVFELSLSEMQPNNDENLPKKLGTRVVRLLNLTTRGDSSPPQPSHMCRRRRVPPCVCGGLFLLLVSLPRASCLVSVLHAQQRLFPFDLQRRQPRAHGLRRACHPLCSGND